MEKVARVRQNLSFNDRLRDGKASIQRQADMAEDILRLIAKSEKAGFPAHRAEIVRVRVNKLPGLPPARARKIEASLRNWLRRREM